MNNKQETLIAFKKALDEIFEEEKVEDTHGNCNICFDSIRGEILMCGKCSSIYCEDCLDKWDSNNCPTCKCHVRRAWYVRNRPLEQMIEEQKQEKNRFETCETHEMQKYYFCTTCKEVCCPECF